MNNNVMKVGGLTEVVRLALMGKLGLGKACSFHFMCYSLHFNIIVNFKN